MKVPQPLVDGLAKPKFGFIHQPSNYTLPTSPLNTNSVPNSSSVFHRHNVIPPTITEQESPASGEVTTSTTANVLDTSGFRRNVFSDNVGIPTPTPPHRSSSRTSNKVIGNRLCDLVAGKPLACEK